jgi:hypothetical protein
MEVVPEEAHRGARGGRRQDARVEAVGRRLRAGVERRVRERERDHREGGGGDRADARRQPVDSVGEVDRVHHPDDADHGEDAAEPAEVDHADHRRLDPLDLDPGQHRDQRRRDLPDQLEPGREVEPVVDRSDQGDRRGAEEDPARFAAAGHEQGSGHQHPGEDRQPTEVGHRPVVEAALRRAVDSTDSVGEAGGERGGQEGNQSRDEERPEGVELVHRAMSVSGAPARPATTQPPRSSSPAADARR